MATKQVLIMLGFAFVAPAALHASVEAIWTEFGASPGMAHEATLIVCVAYAAVAAALAGAAMRGLLGGARGSGMPHYAGSRESS
jgi:hypothetical protein